MNEKEKDLLIKDLCARIPYNVVGKCEIDASYDTSFDTVFQTHKFNAEVYGIKEDLLLVTPLIEDNDEQTYAEEEVADGVSILDFTPYLFPLSSMTDKQAKEIQEIVGNPNNACIIRKTDGLVLWLDYIDTDPTIWLDAIFEVQDYLNKNHFDYRGLIEKGLAIDVTGLNIY